MWNVQHKSRLFKEKPVDDFVETSNTALTLVVVLDSYTACMGR